MNGDSAYQSLLQDVSFEPVFILGDHRSGTTLLYQMLVATGCFNYVTPYSIIHQRELLSHYVQGAQARAREELASLFLSRGLSDRIIDGVPATPDLPEEYAFVLRPSGFRPQLNPRNLAGFQEFCRKVQFVSNPDSPLLLKNPWDFLNFMYVKSAFPAARFVFIHREPVHVINSALRATRALFESESPYLSLIAPWYARLMSSPVRLFGTRLLFSSHLGLGPRIVTRHTAKATSYYLDQVGKLPGDAYVSIRYEDLCEEPERTITPVMDFLGLEPVAKVRYNALIDRRPLRLLPEVRRREDAIRRRLRRYREVLGYES